MTSPELDPPSLWRLREDLRKAEQSDGGATELAFLRAKLAAWEFLDADGRRCLGKQPHAVRLSDEGRDRYASLLATYEWRNNIHFYAQHDVAADLNPGSEARLSEAEILEIRQARAVVELAQAYEEQHGGPPGYLDTVSVMGEIERTAKARAEQEQNLARNEGEIQRLREVIAASEGRPREIAEIELELLGDPENWARRNQLGWLREVNRLENQAEYYREHPDVGRGYELAVAEAQLAAALDPYNEDVINLAWWLERIHPWEQELRSLEQRGDPIPPVLEAHLAAARGLLDPDADQNDYTLRDRAKGLAYGRTYESWAGSQRPFGHVGLVWERPREYPEGGPFPPPTPSIRPPREPDDSPAWSVPEVRSGGWTATGLTSAGGSSPMAPGWGTTSGPAGIELEDDGPPSPWELPPRPPVGVPAPEGALDDLSPATPRRRSGLAGLRARVTDWRLGGGKKLPRRPGT